MNRPYTNLSRFFTEANRRPVADQFVTEFQAWMESQS
jgi:hypothetical protein